MAIELQQGETSLGNWTVNCESPARRATNGSLMVTDRRILFDPKMEAGGRAAKQIRQSLSSGWKANNTVTVDRDQVTGVEAKKGFFSKKVIVSLAGGETLVFNRGMMSVDPILAALGQG
jgi:hypothetical protein